MLPSIYYILISSKELILYLILVYVISPSPFYLPSKHVWLVRLRMADPGLPSEHYGGVGM